MLSVLAEVDPVEVDAVIVHVATNHLEAICNDIRHLDRTLDQHHRLIREAQDTYPGVPLIVSGVLPRFDE